MIDQISQLVVGAVDLIAAFLLLYGLHRMASPVTAPSGIFVAGIGMAVAILVTFLDIFGVNAAARPFLPVNIGLAVIALTIGGGVSWWGGRKVAMTAMPQMVAIYNGMGGGAAGSIAAVELLGHHTSGIVPLSVTLLGALIGIMMTLPIGGADMPVVISIYNAFTGLAVGLEGFVLQNPALMIAGMVVGAAGLMLTMLMARAMNRSISNVLFSNFGDAPAKAHGAIKGEMKPTEPADAGTFMRYAKSVIIVPGYGLAAAQGQQKLYEFVKLLQGAGVSVKFAIHPVAGRMPGQMDVLLAEAGVPYNMIFQLDDINAEFADTDVALVIGANDVVNPAARNDKSSPIYGMPILNADQAKQVYVIKRGQGKGYAGIQNALFYGDNCNMVYGDATSVLATMIEAVRGLGTKAAA